ncbi:unnamed protein product [Heligmosomoides polygyrus]|uniref:CPW_WPC domain-containing protein n=1 Tax=Heligmosomoides polygyrus TaxID=6339 RepID=A0A183GL29_HELPZ|nr:unnamed protein product [Heligmosomoides polygyrus]
MAVSVPRGATGNCPFWRVEPNTDTRLQATGPCDKPAYEDPCHITWCMTVQVLRDSASYGVRDSRRALAKPGECEKYVRVPDARMSSGGN